MIIDFDFNHIPEQYIKEALAGCFTDANPLKPFVFGHAIKPRERWIELVIIINNWKEK